MDRWVTDRPPTIDEVADWSYMWIMECSGKVDFATGYYVRTNWNRVDAWEPPPKPYSEVQVCDKK
jgi:hypothetical protein